MKRQRQASASQPDWIDGDFYLHVNSHAMRVAPGSRQRAMPCIVCATPAGGQPCYLVCLVAGILCPTDQSHLNAAGLLCHQKCLPESQHALISAVTRVLTASGH